jgi:RNA polymerase sigma factor for flagellar operon FliA
MKSMHGVPSSLIARNESWVRKQASTLVRRLPSNIEKADLIQVGLIAVAQSALTFEWEGDRESEAVEEAFVRYARLRVKGAMLDELRQMDQLSRGERRKVKVVQIARARWLAAHGSSPSLADLSRVSGIGIDEISRLEQAAAAVQTESLSEDTDDDHFATPHQPATPADEVEARVDTAIVMRRLASFFEKLPERERQVIDAYLGVGLSPTELAGSLGLTTSRVSQIYRAVCERIAQRFGYAERRAVDRKSAVPRTNMSELIALREAELAQSPESGPWGEMIEEVFTAPALQFCPEDTATPIIVPLTIPSGTRWG